MPEPTPFRDVLLGLLHPWIFMGLALSHLPGTIIRRRHLLLSPRELQSAWFSSFWSVASAQIRQRLEKLIVALLRGRVSGGRALGEGETATVPAVSGTVVEIGPGLGMWVSLFSDKYLQPSGSTRNGDAGSPGALRRRATGRESKEGAVTRVFGIEPNHDMHATLGRKIQEAGLEDVYEIVPVGIEDLEASGRMQLESVDCIVSILCLCGIPEPQKSIKELYGYLKHGGRWYVFEHVRCSQSKGWFMGIYQSFVNLFWPHIIGGCQLRRDTRRWLTEAGAWSHIDLAPLADEPWYGTVPHVVGVLTK